MMKLVATAMGCENGEMDAFHTAIVRYTMISVYMCVCEKYVEGRNVA
jgi:hypothetical protein